LTDARWIETNAIDRACLMDMTPAVAIMWQGQLQALELSGV
jgi:hypothetical protein